MHCVRRTVTLFSRSLPCYIDHCLRELQNSYGFEHVFGEGSGSLSYAYEIRRKVTRHPVCAREKSMVPVDKSTLSKYKESSVFQLRRSGSRRVTVSIIRVPGHHRNRSLDRVSCGEEAALGGG